VFGERRRRRVVGTPPDHELLVTEFGAGLRLVLSLEGAVVAFVEPPGALDRNPVQSGLLKRDVGGADGPLQQGGVDHIGADSRLGQQPAPAAGFLFAFRGQVHVHPAGEQPFSVPHAFAVAQQNQSRHVSQPSDSPWPPTAEGSEWSTPIFLGFTGRTRRQSPAPPGGGRLSGCGGSRRVWCAIPTPCGSPWRTRVPAPG